LGSGESPSKVAWHQKEVKMPSFGAGLFGQMDEHRGNHGVKLFILLVFLLHWHDVFNHGGYSRNGMLANYWGVWYLILALVIAPLLLSPDGFFGTWKNIRSGRIFIYLGVSVGAWLLPVLLDYVPNELKATQIGPFAVFDFFLIVSPIWAMYVFFSVSDDKFINAVRNVWLFIWIGLLIITLLASVSGMTAPIDGEYNIRPWETIKDVLNYVWDAIQRVWATITGVGKTIPAFIKMNLNDTLGMNYRGDVDDYSSPNLGVRFGEIETERRYFEGGEVLVRATVVGEPLSTDKPIALTLSCFTEDQQGNRINGNIDTAGGRVPGEILFTYYQPQVAFCTFTNLSAGSYTIHFAGIFNFETWSYIPYYFAPHELINDIRISGGDPAREANIIEHPVAKYNPGPV